MHTSKTYELTWVGIGSDLNLIRLAMKALASAERPTEVMNGRHAFPLEDDCKTRSLRSKETFGSAE